MARKNESCSDERLAEIILKEGDLGAFNREYWHPKVEKYQGRHGKVLDSLRRGTRHHLKGNFSDDQFSDVVPHHVEFPQDVVDNMWYNSYDCTHHQKSEEFYGMFKEEVRRHVKDDILPGFKGVEQTNVIKLLASDWTNFKSTMITFSELFRHLELWTEDGPEGEKLDGIEKVGLNAFKQEVVLEEEVLEKLTSALMSCTEEHRKGVDVDDSGMKATCDLLAEMNCYEKVFEENFLNRAKIHFEKVARENLKTMSSHDYVEKVEVLIANETESNGVYVKPATTESTTKLLEKVLITDNLQAVVYKEECGGVPKMLRLKAKDQLKSVYVTVKRVDGGLDLLKKCLSDFIAEEGKKIVKDFDRKLSVEYIENFVQLKKTCDNFLIESFDSNCDLTCFTDAEFSKVVSDKKIVESLSIYLDKKFRSIKNDDVNEICDDFMLVFKEIREKEFFKIVFHKHLCKRLIDPKNLQLENEKTIIEHLKAECGCNYTLKFDTLIKDSELNETRLKDFKSQNNLGPITNIKVLTSTAWPLKTGDPIKMPPCILEAYNKFSDFYKAASGNTRKLSLQNFHGVAEVQDFVPNKVNRTLEVNNFQLAVILLFNRQEQWTVQDMLNECDISFSVLKNVLRSLAFGKKQTQVLAKVSSGNEILLADSFKVIENQSRHRKVKIPMIPSKEEKQKEIKQSLETFNVERNMLLEAAIVRIMKTKKILAHNVLIAEVLKEIKDKFTFEISQMKKCIETLIEKDYLERDPDDKKKYVYKS